MYRRNRPQPQSRNMIFTVCLFVSCVFTLLHGLEGSPIVAMRDFATVSTAGWLQQALRTGVQHVVVNEHLDITELYSSSDGAAPGVWVLSMQQNAQGQYTRSIRGNCTAPPPSLQLDPPPKPHQCVITVRQDFLDIALADSIVWLSDLYIRLAGLPRTASVLITSRGRALYMTNMTLAGDGHDSQALRIRDRSTAFISGSHFSRFRDPWAAAIQLSGGARATAHETAFSHNSAVAGPVAGLSSSRPYVDGIGSVLWLDNCYFIDNHSSVQRGGLAVISDTSCYVYTQPGHVRVWLPRCGDENGNCGRRSSQLKVKMTPADQVGGRGVAEVAGDVFAHVAAAAQPLPRPSDAVFRQIMGEAAARTGLLAPQLAPLLPGSAFYVVDLSSQWWVTALLLSPVYVAALLWLCCIFGRRVLRACCRVVGHVKAGGAAVLAKGQAVAVSAAGSVKAAFAARRLRPSGEVALQPQRDASSASVMADSSVPSALLDTM
eukprot:jgi/Ulvmu1/8565/UM045_0007.1